MSDEKKKPDGRGGARQGAGRKSRGNINWQVRATPEEIERMKELLKEMRESK